MQYISFGENFAPINQCSCSEKFVPLDCKVLIKSTQTSHIRRNEIAFLNGNLTLYV